MVDDNSCPKCGCGMLDYDAIDFVDSDNAFRYVRCPNCTFEGKAWYSVIFVEWWDENGNPIEIL